MSLTALAGDRLAVKICGLRSVDRATGAARAGAGLLGFNFAPVSKRRVEVAVAREAIAACRAVPAGSEAGTPGGGRRAPPPPATAAWTPCSSAATRTPPCAGRWAP